MQYSYDLDTQLIGIPDNNGSTPWTIRDAVEGVQIFGGIGSGKTSGSGRMIALKYLSHGFGGLVLTTKPDEKDMWEQYCEQSGRKDDLIIVEPGRKNYFNFLEYESTPGGDSKSITDNIVQVLKTVIKASEQKSSGKSDDAFWENALDMLMFNAIDLCILAHGKVTVKMLYDFVQFAPRTSEDGEDRKQENEPNPFTRIFDIARDKVTAMVDEWTKGFTEEEHELYADQDFFNEALAEKFDDARKLQGIDQFFMETFKKLSEKTRSIIDFSFSGFLFRLMQDPVYSLFCRHSSNFTPEDCWNGKIIVVNLPVKKYHKTGRDSQIMMKYIWQRAMEKRDVKEKKRPVFLFADEAQHFLHEYDPEYQATARSSMIATVYISQNLPNYHANMGGNRSEYKVKSFLGTLGTKIFHSNADIETNMYASQLIGEAYSENVQRGVQVSGKFSSSTTTSVALEKMVRPEQFVGLLTGGPKNNCKVEGYIHRQGTPFHNGHNFIKLRFSQQ